MNKEIENNDFVKGGVREEVPSIRLYEYSKVCGASIENKKSEDYPETFLLNKVEMGTNVKNQGTVGACVACATATAMEAIRLRSLLNLSEYEPMTEELLEANKNKLFGNDELSVGYTYSTCRYPDSTHEGMIVTVALDYLKEQGTVPQKLFDYLEEMPDIKETAAKFPELATEAEDHRIKSYVTMNYSNPRRDLEIKDALMRYRVPIVCVIPRKWNERHCVCIVGWDDINDSYYIKNSWGESWGDNGVARISKSEFNAEVYLLMDKDIKMPFEDVKVDDWFYSAVQHVYMSDLMNGKTDTQFCPNEYITRAEFATAISRLMKKIDERFENFNKLMEEKFN